MIDVELEEEISGEKQIIRRMLTDRWMMDERKFKLVDVFVVQMR